MQSSSSGKIEIRNKEKRSDLILSLLTGVLLSLAFPPLKLGFLSYIGLIPFYYLLQGKSYWQSVRWGYITGFFVNLGTLYWINWVTLPGGIAALFYLPVYFIIYSVLHTFLRQRISEKYFYFCLPFLWTGVEFFRSLGVLGFPWNSLAYTQTYFLSLIQYASYTSIFGVSFWIAAINVLILLILKNSSDIKKVITYFIVLILWFIVPWLYGQWIIPDADQESEDKIRVGLVQGNVDPYLKWTQSFKNENLRIYETLSRKLDSLNLDLIIWPETATPVYLRDSEIYLDTLHNMIDDMNLSLITGTPDYKFYRKHAYKTYNAAFLFTPFTRKFDVYYKMRLVPFGEQVPFTETFPLLKNFLEKFEWGEGNFSSGEEIVSFRVPRSKNTIAAENIGDEKISHFRVPVVICFESIFSNLVRKFVAKGADILVIITNDAWFGPTSAPFQHAQIAVFRAIENRIPIARCANTGVSMFINEYGKVLKSTRIFESTVLSHELPLREGETFFFQNGHIFAIAVSLFNLVPLFFALIKPEKKKNNTV